MKTKEDPDANRLSNSEKHVNNDALYALLLFMGIVAFTFAFTGLMGFVAKKQTQYHKQQQEQKFSRPYDSDSSQATITHNELKHTLNKSIWNNMRTNTR